MKYDLRKACECCPFLRDDGNHPKAVRLRTARIVEIHNAVATWHGGEFPCHKTVDYYDEEMPGKQREQHCAGALAYAGKLGEGSQVARFAVFRMQGLTFEDYGPPEIVFDSLHEFKAAALDGEIDIEPCCTVGPDCIAPAGYIVGGDIQHGTESADERCAECGEPTCSACISQNGLCDSCED